MNKQNIDQALAALSDALYSDDFATSNPLSIIESLPKHSISGDLVSGGTINQFSSRGITDHATSEQMIVNNESVSIKALRADIVRGNLTVEDTVVAKTIIVDTIKVKEIITDIKVEKSSSITFTGDISSKGLIWNGKDYNKQFVFNPGPDRFFSSESIDINQGRFLSINGVKVLGDDELGPTVVKSNLREVGRLNGLIVDGDIRINQYLCYNSAIDRLGLGIEDPHAAFSVAEMGIEVMMGTDDDMSGLVGTYGAVDFNIVTDNTTRINIGASGNILIGNAGKSVSILGKLGIGVKNIDPNVDLHVTGPVRLNNQLQMYASEVPTEGIYKAGDICWNSHPTVGKFVGWVCVSAGSPGNWFAFGEIKDRQ
jgi:hypothetical protein